MCEGRSIPSHWLKRENYRESESVELKEIETGVGERRMQLRSKVFYVWILGFLWFFTKTKICSQGFQKWIVWYLVKNFNHHLKRLCQKTYWLFPKKKKKKAKIQLWFLHFGLIPVLVLTFLEHLCWCLFQSLQFWFLLLSQ